MAYVPHRQSSVGQSSVAWSSLAAKRISPNPSAPGEEAGFPMDGERCSSEKLGPGTIFVTSSQCFESGVHRLSRKEAYVVFYHAPGRQISTQRLRRRSDREGRRVFYRTQGCSLVTVAPGVRTLAPHSLDRQGIADPHLPRVVSELLAAVEASHVGLTRVQPTSSDRCDRTGQMSMSAAKEQINNVVDQLGLPIPTNFRLYHSRGTQFLSSCRVQTTYSAPVCNCFCPSDKNPKVYLKI